MSLQITLTTNYGVNATYHKVISTNIDYLNQSAHVVLAGYSDQTALTNGNQPLTVTMFDWSGIDFPFTVAAQDAAGADTLGLSYTKIKQSKLDSQGVETNFWVNAINV